MKKYPSVLLLILWFLWPSRVNAQEVVVSNFASQLTVNKDTSITVRENVDVLFSSPRHGIFRVIPVVYTYKGKTINSRLDILSVTDGNGKKVPYEKERLKQSVKLKIGDADKTVSGLMSYTLIYKAYDILQDYGNGLELYWNVTGSEWEIPIKNVSAEIVSEYAGITNTRCYTGSLGNLEENCLISVADKSAIFSSDEPVSYGYDFSIVTGFSQENDLVLPGLAATTYSSLYSNWGYVPALIPVFLVVYLWYILGRDKRYLSDNIYYEPEDKNEKTVSVFERKFLPLVYHPIDGLTPSEVGTIVDERVDIHDVVAEILELARLGFINIRKIEQKRFFKDKVDYAFIKTDKYNNPAEQSALNDYQQYLLKEIFRSTIIHKSVKNAIELFKDGTKELEEAERLLAKREYVLLSAMKFHFHEGLNVFRDKLYKRMASEGIFEHNPETARVSWIMVLAAFEFIAGLFTFFFFNLTYNYGPFIVQGLGLIPGVLFALSMPRRSPKGYALLTQIIGLKWYLEKGKWRHEIAEKKLFIEEILPLAVSLGVVTKLAEDMKELNVPPPQYFAGSTLDSFSRDFGNFRTSTASTLVSTQTSSGGSSWSGGSGFSGGGGSGGGFGGGGGGSW